MSLVQLMTGEAKSVHTFGYGYFRNVQRMVRDKRWKFVWYPEVKKYQLFDLETDPHELRNLAHDPAHRKRMTRMRSQLIAWFHEAGDVVSE